MNLVQKYGGKYLRNMEDLNRIADHVAEYRSRVDGLVLVMASMHEIAEQTLTRAETFGEEISRDKLDALFSASELQTAALMACALEKRGVGARVIEDIRGQSLDIVDRYRGKHEIMLDRIEHAFLAGEVAVIPGFQGFGDFGMEDRLGRYGSAATAVAIAGGLKCGCELYGNAEGVCVVDPKVSESRTVFPKISYEEAMELTALGETDLEAGAIELAKTLGVEVFVGPAFNENRIGGTFIVDRSVIVQEAAVSGISVSDDIVMYTIKDIATSGDAVSELFEMLGDLSVNVDVISQQTYSENACAVSFSCSGGDIEAIDKAFAGNSRFCNLEVMKKEDICLVTTDVGDKFVYDAMKQNDYRLGGEQTGHIIFSRYATTGDGVLTSLKVMEVMMAEKKSLSELTQELHLYPQEQQAVPVQDKEKVMQSETLQALLERTKQTLSGRGSLLVRPSGTEPVIRVGIEAPTMEEAKNLADAIAQEIQRADGE